nr:2652_t:CDS:2 [Entrophospora candida]
MTKENQIPKTETVYEIKNEYKVPSFEEFMKTYEYDALRATGVRDVRVGGQASSSLITCKDFSGEVKILSGTAGGEISSKSIKGKLSADLMNLKGDGIQIRTGISADTGISLENGFEFKAVGFGFSVGKQTGISTPVGEIKFDTDN